MSFRYWAMIAILGIIFGGSFALNEILLREIGPFSVSFGRVALGAMLCWSFVLVSGKKVTIGMSRLVPLLLLAATNFAIPLTVFPIAQADLASGVTGVMNGLTPIAVAVISHFWPGGERVSRVKFLGVLCGFLGVCLMAIPEFGADDTSALWAMVFVLLGPISYGISVNIIRKFKDVDATVLVAVALTLASIMLVPLMLIVEGVPVITQTATWVSLCLIGFVTTGLAFIGLYWLIPRVGGTNMSTATFVSPVSAILLGVFLLHEKLETAHLFGMFAIFCGMLLIDGRIVRMLRRKRVTP